MKFQVSILGCGSALPTLKRNQSSQIVNVNESEYMIDCGEGTQIMMRKWKKRFQRINHIFISHLHGDHYYGLLGFLSTLHLLGRENEMKIYAPFGMKEIIEVHQRHSKSYFRFPLKFIELTGQESELIHEDKKVEIYTIPLKHKIYCNGFLIKEKEKERNILPEMIARYSIPLKEIKNIKKGADFVNAQQEVIPNKVLTKDPLKPRVYAYCSDTQYNEEIIPIIKNADALYHEATFCEEDEPRARETKHATAKQAGIIARKANVGQLVIGHFSARYADHEQLLHEAQAEFTHTTAAMDGTEISL